jgi:predicted RND superfamily exporter protein
MAFAMRRTFLSAGKAIVLTSLMLMGGFVSLMFSSFSGVFSIGLLVSLTLCMAVILDLTLLPALLSLVGRRLNQNENPPSIGK